MKSVLGEYGKLIVLAIIFCALLPFLFGSGKQEFRGLVSSVSPKETVGNANAFTLAKSILVRKSPYLNVKPSKLHQGEEYDLLDKETFQIKAENEDGEAAAVSVVGIIDPDKQDITATINPIKFVPQKCGSYHVMYEASEDYLGSTKISKKEYCFLVE